MKREGNEFRPGERFTVALDAGSPIPAGVYLVEAASEQPDGDLLYRVRSEDGVFEVRHGALRSFSATIW